MGKAVLGSLSPVSIPPGAAVQARRSPERVLLFPESSTNTNPLGRAGASGGTPSPAPLPPLLRKALELVPGADEYSRPGPN